MVFEREDVSDKNAGLAAMLCLFFGFLGAHRFYVGKYITGTIYLVFGALPIGLYGATKLFGFSGALASILISIGVFVAMMYDLYAMYSESFFDKNGKILLSGSRKDELFGRTESEKFNDKLTTIMVLLVFVALAIVYFTILNAATSA